MADSSGAKTSAARIKRRERDAQALELRKNGATFKQIADALGYRSIQSAHQAVTRCIRELTREVAEEVRDLELQRLDQMLLDISPQLRRGDLKAVDRALRIMDRRAKLLGLDAPARTDVTTAGMPLSVKLSWPEDQRQ